MQIFIGSTAYEVDAAASVESLKALVENVEFVPRAQVRLTHPTAGVLEEDLALVEEGDELTLSLETPVGMRAKWRKKRMRRLRRKRRKMRARAK